MEYTSSALLLLEWENDVCHLCKGARPHHESGCVIDHALEERGFVLQTNRDAGRKLLDLTPEKTAVPQMRMV